ncbi:MAG: nicotinamide riboside transporter PnuC, partial [Candidatus Absconditabacterales bacterium]
TGLYGRWIRANIGKQQHKEDDISHLSKSQRINTIVILTLGTIGLGYITSHLHIRLPTYFTQPATFVALDAFTTVLSFIATMLLVRKKIEARYLWILVDIIGIRLYYAKGVQFIAAEYVLFLILATSGLIQWIKLYRKQNHIAKASS